MEYSESLARQAARAAALARVKSAIDGYTADRERRGLPAPPVPAEKETSQ